MSTIKPVNNVLIVVDALQNDKKILGSKPLFECSVTNIQVGVNCISALTDVVTGDSLLQLDNTLLKESEPLCRTDMHSDTHSF